MILLDEFRPALVINAASVNRGCLRPLPQLIDVPPLLLHQSSFGNGTGRTSEAYTEAQVLARSVAYSEFESTGDPFSPGVGTPGQDLVRLLR